MDGESHTGREWSELLGIGCNIINTYIRKYGLENTKDFIRTVKGKELYRKGNNQSYYDYYMNNKN